MSVRTRSMMMPRARNQASARRQKAAAVAPCLVGQDFGVGEAAVVVDGGVQVGVAERASCARRGGPAVDPVAAAGGDAAELLDVDVDQLTGAGRVRSGGSGRGLAVQVAEPVQVVADAGPGRWSRRAGRDGWRGGPGRPFAAASPTDLRSRAAQGSGSGNAGAGWSGHAARRRRARDSGATTSTRSAGDAHGRGHMGDRECRPRSAGTTAVDPAGSEERYGDSRGPPGRCAGFDTCTPTSGGLRVGGPLPRRWSGPTIRPCRYALVEHLPGPRTSPRERSSSGWPR